MDLFSIQQCVQQRIQDTFGPTLPPFWTIIFLYSALTFHVHYVCMFRPAFNATMRSTNDQQSCNWWESILQTKKDNISVWFIVNYASIMSLKSIWTRFYYCCVIVWEFEIKPIRQKKNWCSGDLGPLNKFSPASFYWRARTKL